MDIKKYIKRLKLSNRPQLDLTGLAQLQKAHLLSMPFENLSIHYGEPIDLSADKLYEKVVIKGRGGFCYELNTLFNELLTKLGFTTELLSARVYSDKKETYGPEFDHMTILVHLPDSSYITDVGFGEFPFEPVPFELNKVHDLSRGSYQIEHYNQAYYC